MKRFVQLFAELDATTKKSVKIKALAGYFKTVAPSDGAWAIYFLTGEKLSRVVPMKRLREWSAQEADIEPWLFEECYEAVGDLAETMALILPAATSDSNLSLSEWVTSRLVPLRQDDEETQRKKLVLYWSELGQLGRMVMHKLMTGSFRVGVSKRSVILALSQVTELSPDALSLRLMGAWEPSAEAYEALLHPDEGSADHSRPYPFYLAHPLVEGPEALGDIKDWQVEWKWDGIRAQVIRRGGALYLWSRGGELMTDRFPDLEPTFNRLPEGSVLDGEIVGWRGGAVLPFVDFQKRIGRKKVGAKLLKDVPARFIAFDALEAGGRDIRDEEQSFRRRELEALVAHLAQDTSASAEPRVAISKTHEASTWETLAELRTESRAFGTEGLMLKRKTGPYRVGRPRGDWWKWKIDPYSVDAVLFYAQRGSGKRASLYTDYTFAAWQGDTLVPFAKAYSGLSDEEIVEVDKFVRDNTLERFGPVRSVKPELVFEIAFEAINLSKRHKSGIAVRFPRIVRRRPDKSLKDAASVESIKALAQTPK